MTRQILSLYIMSEGISFPLSFLLPATVLGFLKVDLFELIWSKVALTEPSHQPILLNPCADCTMNPRCCTARGIVRGFSQSEGNG